MLLVKNDNISIAYSCIPFIFMNNMAFLIRGVSMSRPSKKGMFGALPVTNPLRELRGSTSAPSYNEKPRSQKETAALNRFIREEARLLNQPAEHDEYDSEENYNDVIPPLTL